MQQYPADLDITPSFHLPTLMNMNQGRHLPLACCWRYFCCFEGQHRYPEMISERPEPRMKDGHGKPSLR